MAFSKYQEKTREYTKLATESETIMYKLTVNIGVRAGGGGGVRGGLQPPPPKILGNSDFLGSKRKFGQSQFSRRLHIYLIILKT